MAISAFRERVTKKKCVREQRGSVVRTCLLIRASGRGGLSTTVLVNHEAPRIPCSLIPFSWTRGDARCCSLKGAHTHVLSVGHHRRRGCAKAATRRVISARVPSFARLRGVLHEERDKSIFRLIFAHAAAALLRHPASLVPATAVAA